MPSEDAPLPDLARVVVVGSSCSGKSTFARALADQLDSAYVELDSLFWLPGWIERDHEEFRSLVAEKAGGTRWVMDGNYRRARDLFWPRATSVIWLNYPFPLVIWRSLKRTVSRSVSGQEICNGNRETWRKSFFSRDSILLWVLTSYKTVQERCRKLFDGDGDGDGFAHAAKIELKSPAEAARLLASIRAST